MFMTSVRTDMNSMGTTLFTIIMITFALSQKRNKIFFMKEIYKYILLDTC